jgi:hypothetical protein
MLKSTICSSEIHKSRLQDIEMEFIYIFLVIFAYGYLNFILRNWFFMSHVFF